MTAPVIDLWVSVTISGLTIDGESFSNVLNFKGNGDVTDPNILSTLADGFWTAIKANYLGLMSTFAQVTSVVARTHYNPPFLEGAALQTFPQFGTYNGDPVPNMTSNVLSWRTKYIGRRYRGRTFFPPVTEPLVVADKFTSYVLNTMSTIAARILTGFSAGGFTFIPAVASRTGLIITPVLSFLVDYFIETIKDRLPRHHRHKRRHT